MNLDQVIKLSYEEMVDFILDSRGLTRHPPPSNQVWEILPTHIVALLACVRLRDAQVGDFIVSHVDSIEKDWTTVVERVEGDWIPIIIGSTEYGDEIVVSYNRKEHYCVEPINLLKGEGASIQGEVIALNFDTFLRINLILDAIKREHLFDEKGMLNSDGHQRLEAALKIFYPNFIKSDYWKEWLEMY